jgi:hypothetical protein
MLFFTLDLRTLLLTSASPAGISPGDYLQQHTAQQQEQRLLPVQQQQQQAVGGGLMPAVQPKLAPQYCVDGPDAVADPLASLLLDDANAPTANGDVGSGLAAGSSSSSQHTGEVDRSQQQRASSTALLEGPAGQQEDLLT